MTYELRADVVVSVSMKVNAISLNEAKAIAEGQLRSQFIETVEVNPDDTALIMSLKFKGD